VERKALAQFEDDGETVLREAGKQEVSFE